MDKTNRILKTLQENGELESFKDWWGHNKALYEKIGIEEEIVYTIWCAAAQNAVNVLRKAFSLLGKS